MAISDITRDAVLEAIGEYDRIGQEGFLERSGFDRARQYLLVHDGKRYDSKAIVGAAHGFLPGERPLTAGEFSGGEARSADCYEGSASPFRSAKHSLPRGWSGS